MNTKASREHEELLTVDGHDYPCLFRRDPIGGYVVTCEEMPPMIAYGETIEDARAHAAEDLTGWIDACDSIRDGAMSLR